MRTFPADPALRPASGWLARLQDGRFPHIDALRALAVSMVVVGHASGVGPKDAGVTIFFVISGYVIAASSLRERDRTGGFSITGFYLRRAIKLAPPFLVCIAIPTAMIWLAGARLNGLAVASQFFFAYNWLEIVDGPAAAAVLPGSPVVWSLAVEEQFYILFALGWLVASRSRRPLFATGLVCVAIIVLVAIWRFILATIPDTTVHILRGTDTRADAIAGGVLLAIVIAGLSDSALVRRVLGSPWLLLGAAAVFVATLEVAGDFFTHTIRYSIHWACAAVFIAFGVVGEGKVLAIANRVSSIWPVRLVGLASYSIYLAHDVVGEWLRPVLSGLPHPGVVVTVIAAGMLAGVVIYLVVEIPALRLRRSLPGQVAKPPSSSK